MNNSRTKTFEANVLDYDTYIEYIEMLKMKYPKVARYVRYDCPMAIDPKALYTSVEDWNFGDDLLLEIIKQNMSVDTIAYYGNEYPISA